VPSLISIVKRWRAPGTSIRENGSQFTTQVHSRVERDAEMMNNEHDDQHRRIAERVAEASDLMRTHLIGEHGQTDDRRADSRLPRLYSQLEDLHAWLHTKEREQRSDSEP
jgi:hypothetical protein